MHLKVNKKVLFVVGMEQKIDFRYVKQRYHILPEEILIIESDELDRIQPYGDLMRDILLHVYQKNIEDIFIVHDKEDRKKSEDIKSIMEKSKALQHNQHTLDYLFGNANPEFPEGSIREWLEGNYRLIEDIQNKIEVIRRHPLMPSSVKVTELRLGKDNETQFDIEAF
ncbi:hypothetical protein R4Z09_19025 [Niallia oryzisoli]|uniref:Carbonic anhydrase n=1 Tax=Niallia oryzisoli TaxID=1737571 RepID=A0ABZ2CA93_9BACI